MPLTGGHQEFQPRERGLGVEKTEPVMLTTDPLRRRQALYVKPSGTFLPMHMSGNTLLNLEFKNKETTLTMRKESQLQPRSPLLHAFAYGVE